MAHHPQHRDLLLLQCHIGQPAVERVPCTSSTPGMSIRVSTWLRRTVRPEASAQPLTSSAK